MVARRLAIVCACLVGALLAPGSASAAAVGNITEFRASPAVITPGPDGNLWYTGSVVGGTGFEPAIGRVTPTGSLTQFTAGLRSGTSLGDITRGPDGNLWFTDHGPSSSGPGAVGRVTPSGTITEFTAGLNPGSIPNLITAGPDGNLWFTDYAAANLGTPAIGRVTPGGTITEFSSGLNPRTTLGPIVAGPDGNVWFIDPGTYGGTDAIGRITPSGAITEFPASAVDIVSGPDGNLWFTGPAGIGRITPGGAITEFSAGLSRPGALGSIVVGPDGNLWFTERGDLHHGGAIGRVTPSGEISEFSDCIHRGVPYSGPDDIAAGPDGNVWFLNNTQRRLPAMGPPPAVGRVTPSGRITEFGAGLNPSGILGSLVAGPDGNLWFADRDSGGIWRVTPSALPANGFILRNLKFDNGAGTATVPVIVPGSGRLSLRGRGVVSRTSTEGHCGTVPLTAKARGRFLRKLNRTGSVRVKARITFTPTGGTSYSETRRIELEKKRR